VTEISRVLSRPRSAVKEQASRGASQPDLTALYDAYARALYRYLVALLGAPAEAEDALQEVLLGLLRRRAGGIRNQRAYLFQAARRQALQALRQRRKRERETAAAAVCWIDPEACRGGDRELALDVQRALGRLPLEQREVIALKLSEDLSFREIGEVLRIPANTAASRYRLALGRLRALLEGVQR